MWRRKLTFEYLEDRRVLSADFNGNGAVDAPDLANWTTGFGTVGTAAKPQGDADVDRDVDGTDFLAWQRTFGQTVPSGTFIDISIDELTEARETAPGAIVFRNSDFSKQSLAATQPEAGLPLYVPDYSAPASLYDPNAGADFTSATVDIGAGMVGQYTMRFTYDATKIQLWTAFNWTGFQAVGGRFKIPSGTIVTPATQAMSFQIEGIQNSAAFSTDSILVEAIPNAGGANLTDTGDYTVIETNFGVDGNRDTAIDFASNYDRQLLFWFNNDQEGFHPTDTAVEAEQTNITTPDNTDGIIDQRRDLEDLAPLRVNVAPLLVNNAFDTAGSGSPAPGQISVTYRLKLLDAAGSALRLFYSNNTNADVIRHVSTDAIANVQATDSFFRTAAGPNFTTQQQLEQITGGSNAFLFESLGGGYGSAFTATPTLEFETLIQYPDGSMSSKIHRIDLDLRDIKQFYTRWDINYGVNGGAPGTDLRLDPSFQHFATPTVPTHSSQITAEPFLSGLDTTVFVHGWNNSDALNSDDKAAGAETMFKRLYWQGYRGEFVAFNWPTFYPEGPLGATYNPSEFQAYRSARALREVLESYRGESPDLQPLHLLAHSMGNIVAGEALRLYTFDPVTVDPLVTNYVAMQAAVSAGAYGSNGTDSRFPGRPEPDLYRFFSHGQQDGLTNPNLGTSYYFQGAGFATENRINMYNVDDYALDLWDANNFLKEAVDEFVDPIGYPYYYWEGWPYGYLWRSGPERDLNVNDDSFERYNPDETFNAFLTLTNAQNRPGVNAYEIMAFFAQSADTAVGTKSVAQFDVNINLQTFGLLGGNNIRANHSYQFNHDAAETWGFYERLKSELGFGATHSVPAIVSAISVSAESPRLERESRERLGWFLLPSADSSQEAKPYVEEPVVDEPMMKPALSRLAILDAYYEGYKESGRRWAAERPKSEVPETLELVWESLGQV